MVLNLSSDDWHPASLRCSLRMSGQDIFISVNAQDDTQHDIAYHDVASSCRKKRKIRLSCRKKSHTHHDVYNNITAEYGSTATSHKHSQLVLLIQRNTKYSDRQKNKNAKHQQTCKHSVSSDQIHENIISAILKSWIIQHLSDCIGRTSSYHTAF